MFELLVANLEQGSVRYETLEGRSYMVVPMVMAVEGVLNGSNGSLFYPSGELAKVPVSWNHKPIVVYHPEINGQPVSACESTIIETRKVGIIMNTKFDAAANKLRSEAWLDVEKTKLVDNRVIERITANQLMEVSTGLFTENEKVSGEFNGTKYTGIARNYRPDHLALLPDKVGACSIKDGAGLLQTNELSHSTIRDALRTVMRKGKGEWDGYIEDVFDAFFIYSEAGKLFRLGYLADNESITVVGAPDEVMRVTEYRTTTGKVIGNEAKEELVVNEEPDIIPELSHNTWSPAARAAAAASRKRNAKGRHGGGKAKGGGMTKAGAKAMGAGMQRGAEVKESMDKFGVHPSKVTPQMKADAETKALLAKPDTSSGAKLSKARETAAATAVAKQRADGAAHVKAAGDSGAGRFAQPKPVGGPSKADMQKKADATGYAAIEVVGGKTIKVQPSPQARLDKLKKDHAEASAHALSSGIQNPKVQKYYAASIAKAEKDVAKAASRNKQIAAKEAKSAKAAAKKERDLNGKVAAVRTDAEMKKVQAKQKQAALEDKATAAQAKADKLAAAHPPSQWRDGPIRVGTQTSAQQDAAAIGRVKAVDAQKKADKAKAAAGKSAAAKAEMKDIRAKQKAYLAAGKAERDANTAKYEQWKKDNGK